MPLKNVIPKSDRKKYQRADGRFYRLFDGQAFYAYTRDDLDSQILDYQLKKRQVIDVKQTKTVDEWYKIWIKSYKASKRDYTKDMYTSVYNTHIQNVIGSIELKDVSPVNITQIMNSCASKSESLQKKVLITMYQLFDTAIDNRLISSNPCLGITIIKVQKEEKNKTLTDTQQKEILSKAKQTRAYIFVALGLYAGLRREESLALTWDDIDWDSEYIHIKKSVTFGTNQSKVEPMTKSSAGLRDIPIPAPLLKILNGANRSHGSEGITKVKVKVENGYNIREIKSKYICPASDGGLMTKSSFKRMWEVVTKRMDVHVTSHMLRHTYCTSLHKAGIDMRTAQYLMGDSDMKTVAKVYTHIENEQIKSAAEKIKTVF